MPSGKSNKNLMHLPAETAPLGRFSVCLPLPTDIEYLGLFLGAIQRLGLQSRYDRDDTHKARLVAQWWQAYYQEMLAAIDNAELSCLPEVCEDGSCIEYPPTANFISYAPNDPFQTPTLTPPGYALPPFYTNPLVPLPGVLPGDAMVNFAALPISANLADLITQGFPRFRVNFVGEGELELELVKVPQGGLAYITVDGVLASGRFVDLNEVSVGDIATLEAIMHIVLEGSPVTTEVIEIETSGAGAHFVDVTFIPNFGEGIILGFGGGLRRVSLCGLSVPAEVELPQFQVVDCMLQWRPNSSSVWIDLADVCETPSSGAGNCMPAGTCVPFAGAAANIPSGWLECIGQVVLRDDYVDLFAAIGTNWNTGGEPANAFRLPDYRGRTLIGAGTGAGLTARALAGKGGAETHQLTVAELAQHFHAVQADTSGTGTDGFTRVSGTTRTQDTSVGTTNTGGDTPHNNMQPYAVTTYIISTGVCADVGELEFRIEDCDLQYRLSSALSWVTLGNVCGTPGDDGVSVVDVTAITTAAGTNASATYNPATGELTLFIPRGDTGATGDCPDDCIDPLEDIRCRYAIGIPALWYQNHLKPALISIRDNTAALASLATTQADAMIAFIGGWPTSPDVIQFNNWVVMVRNREIATPGSIDAWITYWEGAAYNLYLAQQDLFCTLPDDGAYTSAARDIWLIKLSDRTVDERWLRFYEALQFSPYSGMVLELDGAYLEGINGNCIAFECLDCPDCTIETAESIILSDSDDLPAGYSLTGMDGNGVTYFITDEPLNAINVPDLCIVRVSFNSDTYLNDGSTGLRVTVGTQSEDYMGDGVKEFNLDPPVRTDAIEFQLLGTQPSGGTSITAASMTIYYCV